MNVEPRPAIVRRDILWLLVALAICLGWYRHYSQWHPRQKALIQAHTEMEAEERAAAQENSSEANRRAAEIAEWHRRIDEEIKTNEEFEAEFDLRLTRAVDNVRRVHAQQAEALARKKVQAEAPSATRNKVE